MITTNISHGGNFYVTATDPSGSWSDPTWIDVPEIDPDLFFDDDGRAYVITSTFELVEIDINTGEILSERRKIWNSTGGRYPEAPHIYKKDGFYYLMAAGFVDLRIEGSGPEFIFSYAQSNEEFKVVEKADARFLSTQTVGWFTGLYVGLYATGNGRHAEAPAVYDWFEYRGK